MGHIRACVGGLGEAFFLGLSGDLRNLGWEPGWPSGKKGGRTFGALNKPAGRGVCLKGTP